MSFDQLMAHAQDIQYLATKHAIAKKEENPAYARNGIDGYYAEVVPPLFEPFRDMPDPAHYDPLINDLRTVLTGLSTGQAKDEALDASEFYPANPTLAKITTAGDLMAGWTGEAAMAFKQKFLDPFPVYSKNHFLLAAALKVSLQGHRAMWASARNDVDKIAHATIDAFDHSGCSNKNTWNVVFTIVSSLAAVTAAFAAPGGAIALRAAIIAATAQTAAVLPPE